MRVTGRGVGNVTAFSPFPQHSTRLSPSTSLNLGRHTVVLWSRLIARPFAHKGRCSDLDGSLPDVRIIHRGEHDDSRVRVVLRDLGTDMESVDVEQVRSTTTTCGWSRCAASKTARPSATCPTMSHSSDSIRQTAFATPGWSSATSTRGRLGHVTRHSRGLSESAVFRCGAA